MLGKFIRNLARLWWKLRFHRGTGPYTRTWRIQGQQQQEANTKSEVITK